MTATDIKSLFQAVESESFSIIPEILNELSQKPETSLKTTVNQRNEQNQTALHIACLKHNADISQVLLEVGADPNVQDVEGRTPAFLVVLKLQECNCDDCTKKAIRCLSILSYHGGSLDIPNGNGITPLYFCTKHRFADCAKALLENGAALGTAKGKPMIEILVERIPSVLETVFDRAVKLKGSKSMHDPEFEVVLDLGVILPPQITLSNQLHNSNGAMNQVFPAEKWFGENYEVCEEMTFLKQLLNFSENDTTTYRNLLRHPLVNVFTDIKWRSLEILYYFFLTMQIIVLVAYSAFVCATIFLDCPYDLYLSLQRGLDSINSKAFPNGSKFNASELINPDQLCEIGILSKTISIFVVLCTFCILMKEFQHAMYDLKEYVKDFFNYFQFVGLLAVIFTVVVAWDHNSPLYSLLYPVSAFGITLAWCQLFVQIGRLPQLAIYVEMFVKIAKNFCWSLVMYSTVLIGFAISFSILFPSKPHLVDVPLSIIQILTMMIGELNYDGLFNDDEEEKGDSMESLHKNDSSKPKFALRHRFSGHVWFLTFVVFITLVLMNLLVGLAVSDIQGIRKNAEIYVIKRRIRYIAYLEKSLFEATSFLPQIVRKFLRENVAIAKSSQRTNFLCCFKCFLTPVELKNCKLTVHPNNQEDKLLSIESKLSIKHWYLAKSVSSVIRICTSGNRRGSGFRQRNQGLVRRGSTASFVGHPIFNRDTTQQSDAERLKRLQFNIKQMDKKMNELDLKIDMILKTVMRPDTPTDLT